MAGEQSATKQECLSVLGAPVGRGRESGAVVPGASQRGGSPAKTDPRGTAAAWAADERTRPVEGKRAQRANTAAWVWLQKLGGARRNSRRVGVTGRRERALEKGSEVRE